MLHSCPSIAVRLSRALNAAGEILAFQAAKRVIENEDAYDVEPELCTCGAVTNTVAHVSDVAMPELFCSPVQHEERHGQLHPRAVVLDGGHCFGEAWTPFAVLWHTTSGGANHWAVSINMDVANPQVAQVAGWHTIDGIRSASFDELPPQRNPWKYVATSVVWCKT